MNIEKWSVENKYAIRSLYSDFLEETGITLEQIEKKECMSYPDFQEALYRETVHGME